MGNEEQQKQHKNKRITDFPRYPSAAYDCWAFSGRIISCNDDDDNTNEQHEGFV